MREHVINQDQMNSISFHIMVEMYHLPCISGALSSYRFTVGVANLETY